MIVKINNVASPKSSPKERTLKQEVLRILSFGEGRVRLFQTIINHDIIAKG